MKTSKTFLLFISICLLMFGQASAQDNSVIFLNYVDKMPPKLLSGNTVVIFMKLNFFGGATTQENVPTDKELLEKLHISLKEWGVNPVAYIIEDPLQSSNIVIRNKMLDTLKHLGAENLIRYAFAPMVYDGKLILSYTFDITAFNGKISLYDNDQDACQVKGNEYEKIMKEFKSKIDKSKLSKKAMTVSSSPGIARLGSVPNGKKSSSFPADVRSSTLLVYQYEEVELPAKKPEGAMKTTYNTIKENNKHVPENNAKLEKILTAGKLKYELIKAGTDLGEKQGTCYQVMPMIFFTTEEKTKIKDEYGWVTDPNTGKNDYKKTENDKVTTSLITVPYISYFLQNTKTKESYFMDYGDFKDSYKSMEAFLKMINSTVK